MSRAPAGGKLKRGAIGGLALARVGMAHLGHEARQLVREQADQPAAQQRHEVELGRILFRALNQLKGTALKLSQLLSMEGDLLPAGVRAELAKGCHQVTPLNRALVHKVFRNEFGQAPEQLFARFDSHAFAAASLGQVHAAELADGRTVAVKVQYPGIAASVGSDLEMLGTVLHALSARSQLLPRKEIIDRVMGQIARTLHEELDYEHEAAQMDWFRAHVTLEGVVIAGVLPEQSSQRVLTMEKLDGLHIDAWLAREPDQAERNRYGQLLFDWFLHSVFELGRIHADPHPGNFLFMDDGRLGLLDFGCTKTLSAPFSAAIGQAWHNLLHPDQPGALDGVRRAWLALGLISPALSKADFDARLMPALASLQSWQLEAFRADSFDFTHKSPYPLVGFDDGNMALQLMADLGDDLLYFDRAYLGLMHLLKRLGATVVTANPWIY